MKKIDLERQKKTPYLDSYKEYLNLHPVVFDVPGHHQGKIKTPFDKMFGSSIYKMDVNAPRGMDNLLHPKGVLKEAQDLFSEACHASYSKFLINGSSQGIQIMMMSVLKANDKVIMPRNCHKSAVNGLILSGAIPIFVMPEIDRNTEIVNQISYKEWKKAIDNNKDAKAIFIINPTYFGATCNLKKIVEYAHKNNMIVMVDEAHGSHFYFSSHLPISAMDAGADISTLSIHKTGGSLTQSSVLLVKGDRISKYDINKTFNMLTTTSPSSILLASLDSSRKFLVFNGSKYINRAIKISRYCKDKINEIKGFKARGKEYFINTCKSYSYDETKLVVEIDHLKLTGFDIYKILKDKYSIQIELGETYVFLLLFTIGSKYEDVDYLIKCLKKISSKYYDENIVYEDHHYLTSFPELTLRPRDAYHSNLKVTKLDKALNKISKEMIMIYPPGIPIIIPGEKFTKDVINELKYYKKKKANILSDYEGSNEVSIVDIKK